VQRGIGKGLQDTFLCEECGHVKGLGELASFGGREVCTGCWERLDGGAKTKGAKA
jgi:hypothetical protein